MKIFSATLTLCLLASQTTQAFALSCARDGFDLASVYNKHAASDQKIMFIVGKFSGGEPRTDQNDLPRKTKNYDMKFEGSSISRSSLRPLSKTVRVKSTCLAHWCGGIPQKGVNTIAAVNVTSANSFVLVSGPCASNQFAHEIDKSIKLIQACMKKGKCK